MLTMISSTVKSDVKALDVKVIFIEALLEIDPLGMEVLPLVAVMVILWLYVLNMPNSNTPRSKGFSLARSNPNRFRLADVLFSNMVFVLSILIRLRRSG